MNIEWIRLQKIKSKNAEVIWATSKISLPSYCLKYKQYI